MLAGGTVARTLHFAMHRSAFDVSVVKLEVSAPPLAPLVSRDVWMGAMVPKRWAKRAVTRNAIKRQIYMVSTDFESAMAVAAHVVRLRAGFDRTQFASATSEVLKTAVRLELQQLFARAVAHAAASVTQEGAA